MSADDAEGVGCRLAVGPALPFADAAAIAGVAGDKVVRDFPSPDLERARGRASSMLNVRFGAAGTAGSVTGAVAIEGDGAGELARELPLFDSEGSAREALRATILLLLSEFVTYSCRDLAVQQ